MRLLWLDDRDTFLSVTRRARLRDTLSGFCYALEDINPPTMFMGFTL